MDDPSKTSSSVTAFASPTSVADKASTQLCVIIDFEILRVVYEQLVEPPGPITGYLTRCVYISYPSSPLDHQHSFSGITAEMVLDPITPNLAAQREMC